MKRAIGFGGFAGRRRGRRVKRKGGRLNRLWTGRPALGRTPAAGPGLEALEPRLLLSALVVDTLNDVVAADGSVSLREAIEAANANAVVNEADASGSAGPDEITFDAGLFPGTITLGSSLPTITEALTITGPGADQLTIDADGNGRLFNLDDGTAASITVMIEEMTLSGGDAAGDGGAVLNRETTTLFRVEIADNAASGEGGGIYNAGTLLVRDSAVIANTASGGDGGAVANAEDATLDLFNSTLSGNTASGSGGGVANASPNPGTISIANSTITDNRAEDDATGDGGGVFTDAGDTLWMQSTIVADNFLGGGASEDDVAGGFDPAGGFNLIGIADGATGLTTPASQNLLGDEADPLDPALEPLNDNGGPTRTHALNPASPAVDAGDNPRLLGTDQRGRQFARLRGDATDIGAFESKPLLDSIGVTFDFGYDDPLFGGNNFFDTPLKRQLLRDAADSIVSRFADDLDAITPGGDNIWGARFFDPTSGNLITEVNLEVAANEIYVFAGGRDMDDAIGRGGAGGFDFQEGTVPPIEEQFVEDVITRGEFDDDTPEDQRTDFGPWGGAITFDSQDTVWHFGETTDGLDGSENDFFSVAIHEMTHLLGFSAGADSFANLVDDQANTFTGPQAVAEYDGAGNPPLNGPDHSHWQQELEDDGVETAMDPNLTAGERKLLTPLDFAALDDLGWELLPADATPPSLNTQIDGLVFDSANPLTFGLDVEDDADAVSVDIAIDGADADEITVFEEPGDQFARLNFVEPDGTTPVGSIVVQLFPGRGGEAVTRFQTLATTDFPDDPDDDPFWTDVPVHRVIPGFIIQTGDAENGNGTGGSPLGDFNDQFELQGDFDTESNTFDPGSVRFSGPGTLAMANSGADSNDSQWFITDRPSTFLNFDSGGGGAHMIFGQLNSGFDVFLDLISRQTFPESNGTVVAPPLLADVELFTDLKDTSFTLSATPQWDGQATAVITLDDGQNVVQQTIDLRSPASLNDDPVLNPVDEQLLAPEGLGQTTINADDDSGLGVDLSLLQFGSNNKLLDRVDFDPDTGVLSVVDESESFVADAVIEGVEAGLSGFFDNPPNAVVPVFSTADGSPDALGLAGGSIGTPLATAVAGSTLFVAGQSGRIEAFDVADPANPALLDSITLNDAVWDLEVVGDSLFAAAQGLGLVAIDAADPANLAVDSSSDIVRDPTNGTPGDPSDDLPNNAALGIDARGDRMYLADAVYGLLVIDIADPANLSDTPLGEIPNPGGGGGDSEVRDVQVVGDRLYAAELLFVGPNTLALQGNVNILDLAADPDVPPNLGIVDNAGNPWGIAVSGNTLYVPDLNANLTAVDVTDPANPLILDSVSLADDTQPYRAAVAGDLLVAADLATGDSRFFDVSDPANLLAADRFNTDSSNSLSGLASFDDVNLFLPAGAGRVAVLDAAEQIAEPEISVDDPDGELADGQGQTVDFGSAELNDAPLARTFTISNQGLASLQVASIDLPLGFTLADDLDSPTIPPAGSDSFTVQLPADQGGTFTGDIVIVSDDVDEPNFTFPVVGQITFPPGTTAVVARHVFYDNSGFDGGQGPDAADADALAADKTPLFADQPASVDNLTSYSRGLNGLIIDIANLTDPDAVDADDFDFAFGNDDSPADWTPLAVDPTVAVDPGAGAAGSDRITLTWDADDAVANAWLQVMVFANADTGLDNPDLFYFGNAIGETFNNPDNLFVDGSDLAGARDNPRNFLDPAPVTDRFDFNRDEFVDGTDFAIARDNPTNFLNDVELITPASGAPPLLAEPADDPQRPEPAPAAHPDADASFLAAADEDGAEADLLAAVAGPFRRPAAPPPASDPDAGSNDPDDAGLIDLLSR